MSSFEPNPIATTEGATDSDPLVARVPRLPKSSASSTIGFWLFVALVLAAVVGPMLVAFGPDAVDPPNAFQPPSWDHPMGTDNLGRDQLSRFLTGARVSMLVGIGAISIGASIGLAFGVVAGLFGKYVDVVVSWIIEVLQTFPGVLLALAMITILGPGMQNLLIAVGVAFIPSFARMTRALVFSLREQTFIEAARAIGNPTIRIVMRHLLPNMARPLTVLGTLGLGAAILEGTALSFLGLGVQPPNPEWGSMLSAGSAFIRTAWWLTVFPGLGIFLAVLASNLMGEGLSGRGSST
jgi:peptide/nickel transport system permease protein